MTVQDNYKLESYITNGSITSFDFSFKVLEKSNIIVNVEDIEGNITQKQQQTDYEIVLNTDFTGTVIFKEAPIKDYKIYIQRIVDLDQEARYETSSGFQAEVIEKSFDKLTMINQQQQTEIDTCLKINQFEDVKISNYAETPIENKGIMWAKNEDGSFYLKNTQENPDTVYNEIVKNENVIAVGSNLMTDDTIGTCANNINNINTTAENINDINLCGGDIENIKNISEYLKKHERLTSNNLFDFKFIDHLLNDESWLRADTFSWQSGEKYKTSFNELSNQQNINYTLSTSNNTLTIKAGSVLVVPYGIEDLSNICIQGNTFLNDNFKILNTKYISNKFYVIVEVQNDIHQSVFGTITHTDNLITINITANNIGFNNSSQVIYSDTKPTEGQTWFDSKNNKYISLNTEQQTILSLPIINFARESGVITAINEVYNGVNYFTKKTENNVEFYRHEYGFKICLPSQETKIKNAFNNTGIAWFYILDTTNQRFKLPRTKWGFVGFRGNVGEYVAESLPNINGSVNSITQGNESLPTSNGALKITDNGTAWQTGSTKYMKKAILTIDASLSSSSYKNNAPVQQRATQMYLYFYVGNFTREAIEETAGLNSELFNNKADRDLNNLNINGQEKITNLVAPSDRYIDLTLGASGTSYTAPANGWFYLVKRCNGLQEAAFFVQPENSSINVIGVRGNATDSNLAINIPVAKDDTITCSYSATGNTVSFRFVYANGN